MRDTNARTYIKRGRVGKTIHNKAIQRKKIMQEEAAQQLQLSVRQVRRLVRRIKLEGSKGIKSPIGQKNHLAVKLSKR